jgi:hypothetical protein
MRLRVHALEIGEYRNHTAAPPCRRAGLHRARQFIDAPAWSCLCRA